MASSAANGAVSADRARRGLGILYPCVRPDNVNLHRRIAKGLPEFELHSYFTGDDWSGMRWNLSLPGEIHPHVPTELGLDVSGSAPRWKREYMKARWIEKHMERHRVCAVLCNGYMHYPMVRIMRVCRRKGIPVWQRCDSNIHCDDQCTGLRKMMKSLYVRQVMRWCTGAMAFGRTGRDYFARYGMPRSRIFPVPLVPDEEWMRDVSAEAVSDYEKRAKLPRNRRRLLYVGRLASVKAIDALLKAFIAGADSRRGWDLVIVGSGPLEEGLRGLVPRRLADRVHWTGFAEYQDVRLALHACDVLVLPSTYEPWGTVVLEAMCVGKPVVATSVCGAAVELIEDRLNGRLVPPANVQALREAVSDVTDEVKLLRYSSAVRASYDRWLSENDPIKGIRQALRSVGLLPPARLAVKPRVQFESMAEHVSVSAGTLPELQTRDPVGEWVSDSIHPER